MTRATVKRIFGSTPALICLVACGASHVPPATETSGTTTSIRANEVNVRSSPVGGAGEAHRLVVGATACWVGGVWSDASGVDDDARARDSQKRCHSFLSKVYGSDDTSRYERFRAVERGEVEELSAKVSAVAKQDREDAAKSEQLVRLLAAIADDERETMYARRAGDKVKKDDTGERTPAKLTGDELDAIGYLKADSAFRTLVQFAGGELGPEARVVATLSAMDRMETARGLPKHLKVYAVEGPFSVLFGVKAPTISDPLPPGMWLGYLTEVAKAAGYPVSDDAKTPRDRELMAWGGTIMGLADKLRVETGRVSSTDLRDAALAVVKRIEVEFRASQSAVRNQH